MRFNNTPILHVGTKDLQRCLTQELHGIVHFVIFDLRWVTYDGHFHEFCHFSLEFPTSYVLVMNNRVQMVTTFSDHVKSRIQDCRFNVVNGQLLLVPVFCMGFYKVKL
jgi:hypothetical protein